MVGVAEALHCGRRVFELSKEVRGVVNARVLLLLSVLAQGLPPSRSGSATTTAPSNIRALLPARPALLTASLAVSTRKTFP